MFALLLQRVADPMQTAPSVGTIDPAAEVTSLVDVDRTLIQMLRLGVLPLLPQVIRLPIQALRRPDCRFAPDVASRCFCSSPAASKLATSPKASARKRSERRYLGRPPVGHAPQLVSLQVTD